MGFRTKIPIQIQSFNQVDYNSKIMLIGSCFSENIGNKLDYYKFQSVTNPLGILFHPKAIERFITDSVNKRIITEEDVFYHNEQWHYFNAHSSLSNINKNELVTQINDTLKNSVNMLQNATHIIITLGTSWVYRFTETNAIVANCHKIPQKKFLKEVLSTSNIIESLNTIISLIKKINKNTQLLFTVSPVRHLKDGFIENQQSKSHLLTAIHQIINKENIHYFPSYEIMMDELRDYRFYKEDMVHPNKTAIDYIWKQFCSSWINSSARKTMQEVETIQKGLAHKPFNAQTQQHKLFLKNLELKKAVLLEKHPFIVF